MGRRTRWLLALAAALLLLAVAPLIVPIPPLRDTVPPQALADPDSRFVEVNGVSTHYRLGGEGEPTLILLHGFGASVFSWREVMAPLAELGTVIAFDRPSSGLTERPLPGDWMGESPYSASSQAAAAIALLDQFGSGKAILVGNSAGGTIAMLAALAYPDRVAALILVSPAVYTRGGAPTWVRPLLRTPQARRLGPLFSRSLSTLGRRLLTTAWHDPARITPEIEAGYTKPLRAENWDRGLWELTVAGQPTGLTERLQELTLPVLVITGDDDRIVPTAESVRLASELPNAELAVIPACGHVAHEECPEAFLEAAIAFVARLP